MKTKRFASGLYEVTHNGLNFEIEKTDTGHWNLYLVTNEGREGLESFDTKREAVEAVSDVEVRLYTAVAQHRGEPS